MTAFIENIPSEVFTEVLLVRVDCSAEDNGVAEVNPFSPPKPVIRQCAGVKVSGTLPVEAQKQCFEIHAVDDPADGMLALANTASGDTLDGIDVDLLVIHVHRLTQTH